MAVAVLLATLTGSAQASIVWMDTEVPSAASVVLELPASEAGLRTPCIGGSTTLLDPPGNPFGSPVSLASLGAPDEASSFRSCTLAIEACPMDVQIDATWLPSAEPIGTWPGADGNVAWLLWGDSGAFAEHDDLMVRLTYRSVPEPGTLVLLGLGLVGIDFARRKCADAA